MGHIPLIHGSDGAKLSKRHGAIGVDHYRTQGFLPETMINGLLRLGWSHGDDEKITSAQAVEWFDGTALSKSAARFDLDKIIALNGHYLRQRAQSAQGLESLWHDLVNETLDDVPPLTNQHWDRGRAILPALAQRANTLCDLRENMRAYLSEHLDPLPIFSAPDRQILTDLHAFLAEQSPWNSEHIEQQLRQWAKDRHIAFGSIAKPLRQALTGKPVSPSLTDVMVALGQDWTLTRIQDCCCLHPAE
jgi:glutamyl-tRNA synthetase